MFQLLPVTNAPKPQTYERRYDRANASSLASAASPVTIFFLLCVTRFYGITNQSLWYDEGYTFTLASSQNFHQFLHIFGGYTTSEHLQPLYYGLIFLWSRIAGTSDLALRVPSAVFSVASGLIMYFLAIRMSRLGRFFPWIASVAYALSSYSIYYAQEARPYALLQLLSFALLVVWILGKESSSSRRILFSVICSLCMLGSPFTVLLVLSLALSDLAGKKSWRNTLRAWSLPAACSFTAFATYLAVCRFLFPRVVGSDVTSIKQPLWMNFGYALYGLFFGTTLAPSGQLLRGSGKLHTALQFWPVILPSALVMFAFAVTVCLLLRSSGKLHPATRALTFSIGLYIALFFGIFGVVGHLNILPRHSCALFSLLFVLTTLCAAQLSPSTSTLGFTCLLLALSGFFAINLISIHAYRYDPSFRKDDYRAVAQVLQHDDHAPAFMTAGQSILMRHYGVDVVDASQTDPANLAEFLRTRSHDAPRIRIVMNEYRGFRWDGSAGVIPVLDGTYSCVEQQHLSYMDLMLCTLNNPASRSSNFATSKHPAREIYAH